MQSRSLTRGRGPARSLLSVQELQGTAPPLAARPARPLAWTRTSYVYEQPYWPAPVAQTKEAAAAGGDWRGGGGGGGEGRGGGAGQSDEGGESARSGESSTGEPESGAGGRGASEREVERVERGLI